MKGIRSGLFGLFGLTLLSLFLWAGFDIKWWVPVETGSIRELILFLLHITGIASILPAIIMGITE